MVLTPHAQYVLDIALRAGMTINSVREVVQRAPTGASAIPIGPDIRYRIEVHGSVAADGRIDEEDTLRRIIDMGQPPLRTAEHPDGWHVVPGSRYDVWDAVVVTTKMENDEVTWADRARRTPKNGVWPTNAEVGAALSEWSKYDRWRIPPEYVWLYEVAVAPRG